MKLLRITTLCLGIAVALPGQALETMDAGKLLAWCSSDESVKVTKCRSYITGFLDGAFATDPRVAQNVLDDLEREQSFSRRAARTRIGMIEARFGPSYYAGFCVPAEAPVEDIQALMVRASASADTATNAREYLYDILQRHYPCDEA